MNDWEASGLAILDRAIEELERRGLNQDGGYVTQSPMMPGETRKVCTLGALYLGAGMNEENLNFGGHLYNELHEKTPLRDIIPNVALQMEFELDESRDLVDQAAILIPGWNDDAGTSVEDVILILKQVREEMYAHAVLAS